MAFQNQNDSVPELKCGQIPQNEARKVGKTDFRLG